MVLSEPALFRSHHEFRTLSELTLVLSESALILLEPDIVLSEPDMILPEPALVLSESVVILSGPVGLRHATGSPSTTTMPPDVRTGAQLTAVTESAAGVAAERLLPGLPCPAKDLRLLPLMRACSAAGDGSPLGPHLAEEEKRRLGSDSEIASGGFVDTSAVAASEVDTGGSGRRRLANGNDAARNRVERDAEVTEYSLSAFSEMKSGGRRPATHRRK